MRSQMKLLSLMVRATVVLLTSGAFLVVLGIFDDLLEWDIFSPEVEKLLRGVFAACVALAVAAVAAVPADPCGPDCLAFAIGRMKVLGNYQAVTPTFRGWCPSKWHRHSCSA